MYVWHNDRDMAFTACRGSGSGNVMCPMWRRELTDDWWGKARWFEQKRRKQAATNEQDIPE